MARKKKFQSGGSMSRAAKHQELWQKRIDEYNRMNQKYQKEAAAQAAIDAKIQKEELARRKAAQKLVPGSMSPLFDYSRKIPKLERSSPRQFHKAGEQVSTNLQARTPTERQKDLVSSVMPHQRSITNVRKGEGGLLDLLHLFLH